MLIHIDAFPTIVRLGVLVVYRPHGGSIDDFQLLYGSVLPKNAVVVFDGAVICPR